MAENSDLSGEQEDLDAFTAVDADPQDTLPQPTDIERVNLADDEKLVEQVMPHLHRYFEKDRINREELEKIWNAEDWMYKCGQEAATAEVERERTDRQGDDLAKTKSQKVGSTLFFRQVRSLAALFTSVLTSKPDPYEFRSRHNPHVFYSDAQADQLANQHNLLMRWTRDNEGFLTNSIELFFSLLKHGNVPIYSKWLRKNAEVLDRWPIIEDVPGEFDGETGEQLAPPTQVVAQTVLERRLVRTDNRPVCPMIPIENFYADQNIGNMQSQNAIFVKSFPNMSDIQTVEREGDYLNVDKVDDAQLFKGRQDDTTKTDAEDNAGFDSNTDDSATGTFRQFDCYALLPIDEEKPKGKRWDAKKHPAKRYWVTVIAPNDLSAGVCLRIERNPDPDDEYPFEMVKLLPGDADKLYGMSLGQALRGNFTEQCTTKAQMLDRKTLHNNRPLKAITGEVHVDAGGLAFGKDKIYWCDNENSLTEFQMDTTPDTVNMQTLNYLDADSDETAGNNRSVRGEAMGGRTSSSEATNAFGAARLPHKMIMQYVFDRWLRFRARKGIKNWHLYADDDQVIKITDEPGRYENIRPIDLYGDFDVEINIVNEFEDNAVLQQTLTHAAQNFFPLFMHVMDPRELAKIVFDRFLHIDISRAIKPDRSEESTLRARQENIMLMDGRYVPPSVDEDFDAMLREHEGHIIQYRGVEGEHPNLNLVARHIEETKFLKQQNEVQPTGSLPAGPQNQTPGQVAGNEIAGAIGAQQG